MTTEKHVADLGLGMAAEMSGFIGDDGGAVSGFYLTLKPGKKASWVSLARLKALKAGLEENIAVLEEYDQVCKIALSKGHSVKGGRVVLSESKPEPAPEPAPEPVAPVKEEQKPVVSETTTKTTSDDLIAMLSEKYGL